MNYLGCWLPATLSIVLLSCQPATSRGDQPLSPDSGLDPENDASNPSLIASTPPTPVQTTQSLSPLEQGIVTEMNRVRTNPTAYVPILESWRQKFQADGRTVQVRPNVFLRTNEGVAAVDEAIQFLKRTRPMGSLNASLGLAKAARDQVTAQGPTGGTGHEGTNGGMRTRIERYGRWSGTIGENISYGDNTAQGVVMQLIIDDGVPSRGHRTNIFQQNFRVTGVACGSHSAYGSMCVIEYAGGFSAF